MGDVTSDDRFDVFISYARQDGGEWTEVLAENLERLGIRAFWDRWEIGPGDVLVHELDRGLLNSKSGILVVTRAAFERPWVQQEYAALVQGAVEGRQRLIPVLLHDVEMPPLLATHVWVDFRGADGPEYEKRVRALADALRSKKPQRPKVGEALQGPPGSKVRAASPLRRRLVVTKDRVELVGGDEPVAGTPTRPSGFETTLWELRRRRERLGAPTEAEVLMRDAGTATEPRRAARLTPYLHKAGTALSRAFLPDPVGAALAEAVREAVAAGASLELGIEVAEPGLRGLPWETLRVPGDEPEPLALHPNVQLYRAVTRDTATPARQIPGPLRVLVAIASPEADNARGQLLDYELELSSILQAVDEPMRTGEAHVEILHRGTVAAIKDELAARDYHLLYLTCHASAGALQLEHEDGTEHQVTAEELLADALPPDHRPPLVVLSGCSTAVGGFLKAEDGEEDAQNGALSYLPGLAESLLAQGVPAVLAMQAPVSDRYATDLGAGLMKALTTFQHPDPLVALSEARRAVEQARRAEDTAPREPEWATPTLYLPAGTDGGRVSLPLYDPEGEYDDIEPRSEARFARGVTVRGVEHFVGRRREERLALKALKGDEHAGVLLHGIGGIGKSTLAVQILRNLGDGWLLASVEGPTDPEAILATFAKILRSLALNLADNHPFRQLASVVDRQDVDWEERLELLAQHFFTGPTRAAFLLDNFEDNLEVAEDGGGYQLINPDLAAFLTRWLDDPGDSRLLLTSRYTFPLPDRAEDRLTALPLGPLSWAESRKLMLRLPAFKTRPVEDHRRAYEQVGGHPRALEYLDALLGDGKAKFHDVTRKLEGALRARDDIDDPAAWLKETDGRDFDQALAETVTSTASDALLDDLLARLEDEPLARRLLLRASVFRRPVEESALAWQVSEKVEREPDPEVTAKIEDYSRRAAEAREAGEETTPQALGFSEEEFAELVQIAQNTARPPLEVPEELGAAGSRLLDLGLLGLFAPTKSVRLFLVHRWTGNALEQRMEREELRDAHRDAAAYWTWRVQTVPQPREQDVEDLMEARHHLVEAGEMERAVEVTEDICIRLDTAGAYRRAARLCHEALDWLPEGHPKAAAFLHELGILAQKRGDYADALDWYKKALRINEELGNRAGLAGSYHQLGRIAEERGDYDAALDWYKKSLRIKEELGNRAGLANSYHQLGRIAQERGDYDDALDWYKKSLRIEEELGNRAGLASSYHQLGMVAEERGDYDDALDWYKKSLRIEAELGNRAGLATSYHQLGIVAQERGDYDDALDWYKKSLRIEEELGNRAGLASSYHQLGIVAQERGDYEDALDWYKKSLRINEELGSRAGLALGYGQIGALYTSTDRLPDGVSWTLRSLAIHLQIGAPHTTKNLLWLGRQREALGEERFLEVLKEELDEEDRDAVLGMLEEFETQHSGGGGAGDS